MCGCVCVCELGWGGDRGPGCQDNLTNPYDFLFFKHLRNVVFLHAGQRKS